MTIYMAMSLYHLRIESHI